MSIRTAFTEVERHLLYSVIAIVLVLSTIFWGVLAHQNTTIKEQTAQVEHYKYRSEVYQSVLLQVTKSLKTPEQQDYLLRVINSTTLRSLEVGSPMKEDAAAHILFRIDTTNTEE